MLGRIFTQRKTGGVKNADVFKFLKGKLTYRQLKIGVPVGLKVGYGRRTRNQYQCSGIINLRYIGDVNARAFHIIPENITHVVVSYTCNQHRTVAQTRHIHRQICRTPTRNALEKRSLVQCLYKFSGNKVNQEFSG